MRMPKLRGILVLGFAAFGLVRGDPPVGDTSAKDFAAGRIIGLPPFLVAERFAGGHLPLYGSVAGLEVLSYAEAGATGKFVESFLLRSAELHELFPDALEFRQSLPLTMILIDPRMEKAMRQEMVDALRDSDSDGISPIPQMTLWDDEAASMLYVISPHSHEDRPFADIRWKDKVDYKDIYLTQKYVASLLEKRTPPLPFWFQYVISRLYQDIVWTDNEVEIPKVRWRGDPAGTRPDWTVAPIDRFLLGPFGGADEGTREQVESWYSQGVLFVRWALDDPSHSRRDRLWSFVDASSREPVTAALFRKCLGMDFSDLTRELSEYLPTAVARPLALVRAESIAVPKLELRLATNSQISRIEGNWECEETKYVKRAHPGLMQDYLDRAGIDLVSAHQSGVTDSPFLAVLGLYDSDIGKEAEARPLLEEAVGAQVARPAIYVKLAHIRYQEDLAKQPDGRLDAGQVLAILGLLRESCRYAPAQVETYTLALEVWNHAAVAPVREDMAFLENGVAFFPRDGALVAGAARLGQRAGFKQEALEIVDRGEQYAAPDSSLHRELASLRVEIAGPN